MPQTKSAAEILAGAKAAAAHADKTFAGLDKPAAKAAPAAAPATAPKATVKTPSIGDELIAKQKMVSGLPKLHKGGPVPSDGAYQLKAGEHVLTAPEAGRARQHALIRAGMRSMAFPLKKTDTAEDTKASRETKMQGPSITPKSSGKAAKHALVKIKAGK